MYLIVYDDGDCLCSPYGADPDCDGAISSSDRPLLFADRNDAKVAIKISRKYSELLQAQGQPHNSDFLPPFSKYIKILRCDEYTPSED